MVMFMNEMRQEMENEHKKKFKLPFDEALYVLCKPLYDQLSEDEKQYYKDMAKSEWTGKLLVHFYLFLNFIILCVGGGLFSLIFFYPT
jgi:hypothetical protein